MKPTLQLFVTGLALALVAVSSATAGPAGIGKSFQGPIGLQLYSLRKQFETNVPGTLDEVKKFGITAAELAGTYKVPPADFKAQLEAHGIRAISSHFAYDQFKDHLDDVVRDAEALGVKYAGCAWIPHHGDFQEADARAAIDVFNKAGEELAKHGIKFFYHTHGYEFQPYANGTLFDLMMTETKPQFVTFEMDIFWIVFPAQDPAKLLEKYTGRWDLMHLKDMNKTLPTGSLAGGTDVKNDVTLGSGQINLPVVLAAAKKVGVKWYFIEDESPVSEEQIPLSLKYLQQVKF